MGSSTATVAAKSTRQNHRPSRQNGSFPNDREKRIRCNYPLRGSACFTHGASGTAVAADIGPYSPMGLQVLSGLNSVIAFAKSGVSLPRFFSYTTPL